MVAVSALQMQAKWGRQFRQQQITKTARFFPLGSQKPKQCQAIQSQGKFNYYEDEQLQIVGIPTQRQELTVYVIVPKEKDGLTRVEKEQIQNGQQLKQLLDICDQRKQYTSVQLPKVQVSTKLDAKKTLLKQGVRDAFDCDQADFSGICKKNKQQQQQGKGENLHLNKLIHQATIKITEQGISAANTGSSINQIEEQIDEIQNQYQTRGQYYGEQDEEESVYGQEYSKYGQQGAEAQVKANRAFAFAVKHKPSNQIILVGRVVDGCQKPNGQPQSLTGEYGFQGEQGIYDEMDEE
jgi:serine protease inhibitor